MVKILLLVLLIGIISGCDTLQISSKPPEKTLIAIPIQCPKPPDVFKPTIPITKLSETDKKNPNKVGKAYIESIKILQNYANDLKNILDSYR